MVSLVVPASDRPPLTNFCSVPRIVIEKKRNTDKPGPGKYMSRSNIDYFANDIRYNNKFTNPKTSRFGAEKRFSFPSKLQLIPYKFPFSRPAHQNQDVTNN